MADIDVEQSGDVIIFHVRGSLLYHELVEAYEQNGHLVTKHVCWDFTNGSTSDNLFDKLRSFHPVAVRCMTNREIGTRTAFVAPTDAVFGALRLYSTVAELAESPYQYFVFRSMDKATYWLLTGKTE